MQLHSTFSFWLSTEVLHKDLQGCQEPSAFIVMLYCNASLAFFLWVGALHVKKSQAAQDHKDTIQQMSFVWLRIVSTILYTILQHTMKWIYSWISELHVILLLLNAVNLNHRWMSVFVSQRQNNDSPPSLMWRLCAEQFHFQKIILKKIQGKAQRMILICAIQLLVNMIGIKCDKFICAAFHHHCLESTSDTTKKIVTAEETGPLKSSITD